MRRYVSTGAGLLASAMAGAALVAAFAPLSWSVLAPFSLAVPFALSRRVKPVHAAAIGYAFGLGLFGAGVAWIHIAVETVGGPAWLAWRAAAGLAVFLSAYPALALGGAAWLAAPRRGGLLVIAWPGLWVLVEWLRGWLFTGFPWLQLGYSQTGTAWADWVAPVGGVLAISLICATVAATLAYGVATRRWRLTGTAVALWAVLGIVPSPDRPIGTQPTGGRLRVALVQGDIAQTRKWQPKEQQAIVDRYRRLSAPYWNRVGLIVWPETAIPAIYVNGTARPYAALAARARHSRAKLFAGTLRLDHGQIYNSVIDMGSGRASDKSHLVPFGEYTPLRPLFAPLLNRLGISGTDLSSGHKMQSLAVAGTKAGMPICYEMAFANNLARRAADAGILVNVSDDVWFGHSIGLWQNREIARMRALETGRPVIRDTNTGLTAVIGADGRLASTLAPFKPGVLIASVQPRTGSTPYRRGGGMAPIIVATLMILLAGSIARGKERFVAR